MTASTFELAKIWATEAIRMTSWTAVAATTLASVGRAMARALKACMLEEEGETTLDGREMIWTST